MAKFIESTIRGQKVTAASFRKTLATIASFDESVTIAANYAAFLLLAHNGPDKINDLIRMDHFRTSANKTNATGKRLIAYIRKFAPAVIFDEKSETFSVRKFKGKDASEKRAALVGVFNLKGEKLAGWDFPLSFKEFSELEKAGGDGKPKAFNASRIEKMADDAMAAIAEGRFSIEDESEALEKLVALQGAIIAELAKRREVAAAALADIDAGKVVELAELKPSAKTRAAGAKTATK